MQWKSCRKERNVQGECEITSMWPWAGTPPNTPIVMAGGDASSPESDVRADCGPLYYWWYCLRENIRDHTGGIPEGRVPTYFWEDKTRLFLPILVKGTWWSVGRRLATLSGSFTPCDCGNSVTAGQGMGVTESPGNHCVWFKSLRSLWLPGMGHHTALPAHNEGCSDPLCSSCTCMGRGCIHCGITPGIDHLGWEDVRL